MTSVQYCLQGATSSQIAASAELAVRDGLLAVGEPLPTVRDLAAQLGVAPGTVAAAYRTLRERGLVQTDGRRGTWVRARPPFISRVATTSPPTGTVDLSTGLPDPSLLPPLAKALARLAAGAGSAASPTDRVLPALADRARNRLTRDGVPDGVLTVTAGALDALERVLTAHLRPGDRVAVEDPGWPNLLDLVASLGLRTAPLALDDDGPRPETLAAALKDGAGAVVLTSRAQNPTGAAVTAQRRDALQDVLAGAPGTLVIEDDHAAELSDVPLAPVVGTTTAWAFVRSLSKPYGPDLRVAVCVGDPTTVSRVEGRQRLGAGWISTLLQQLAVELWDDPEADRAIARAARVYAVRRTALLTALAERGVPARGGTGLNVWVSVPDETTAVSRLLAAGWLVAPGARFRVAGPPAVRISVGALDERNVDRLADALAPRTGADLDRSPTYSA